MRNTLTGCILLLLFSCSSGSDRQNPSSSRTERYDSYNSSDERHEDEDDSDSPDNIDDGTYSADVEYYNPDTGTQSSYSLEVDVEDNQVTVIRFPKGGWLDDSHIVDGGELDDDGSTTIYTDRGVEYEITIDQ